MSNPHIPLDPDPLNPTDLDAAYAQGFADAWEATKQPRHRERAAFIVALGSMLALVIVAFAAGRVSATWVPSSNAYNDAASCYHSDHEVQAMRERDGPWPEALPAVPGVSEASEPAVAADARFGDPRESASTTRRGSDGGVAAPRRPVFVLRRDRGRVPDGRPPEQRRCQASAQGHAGRPVPVASDAGGLGDLRAAHPVLELPSGGVDAGELSALESGIASWYSDPSQPADGLYAAVPSWRFGDTRYSVRVCRADVAGRCVTVQVRDFCGCPGARVIDLSREAFARLAPLSAGLVRVTIESPGVSITPPPTETEP